jgi:hypothetical protein
MNVVAPFTRLTPAEWIEEQAKSDLFVWVTSHQQQLSEVYGYDVQMSAATDHVKAHHGSRWFRRALPNLQERLARRQHSHRCRKHDGRDYRQAGWRPGGNS